MKSYFDVVNGELLNMVKVELENASFRYEAGAMHYMKGNLELESDIPGVGIMFKSMITHEKIIKPVISGTGTVFMQPSFGEFTILNLQNDEWIFDQRACYASEMSVEIGAFYHVQRGLTYLALKQIDKAKDDATIAINLSQNLPEAHDLMSKVFEKKGDIKKALDECELAYKLSIEKDKLSFMTPEGQTLSDRLVDLRGKYLLSK